LTAQTHPVFQSLLREFAQDEGDGVLILKDIDSGSEDDEDFGNDSDETDAESQAPDDASVGDFDNVSELDDKDADDTKSVDWETSSVQSHSAAGASAGNLTKAAWCRMKGINPRAFQLAANISSLLRRKITTTPYWTLSATQQNSPTGDELAQVLFQSFVLNLAYRPKQITSGLADQYQLLRSQQQPAVLHYNSSILSKATESDTLQHLIVYQTLLRTGRSVLCQATPVNPSWLETSPRFLPLVDQLKQIQSSAPHIFVIRNLAPTTLQSLLGKLNSNIETLTKELNCSEIQVDSKSNSLMVICQAKDEGRIRDLIKQKIELVKSRARDEVLEEAYLGSTRIVWGEGCKVLKVLKPEEYAQFILSSLFFTLYPLFQIYYNQHY